MSYSLHDIFDKSKIVISIPKTDSELTEDLLNSAERDVIYFDENLFFFLVLKSDDSNSEILKELVNTLDIRVSASTESEMAIENEKEKENQEEQGFIHAPSISNSSSSIPNSIIAPPFQIATPTKSTVYMPTPPQPILHSSASRTRNPPTSTVKPKKPEYRSRSTSLKDGLSANKNTDNKLISTSLNKMMLNPDFSSKKNNVESYSYREDLIYAYKYDIKSKSSKPIIGEKFIIFPLALPIDTTRIRPESLKQTEIIISVSVTQNSIKLNQSVNIPGNGPLCDGEEFDSVNLFEGLIFDPNFNSKNVPKFCLSQQSKQKSINALPKIQKLTRKLISVKPFLSVQLTLASISSEEILMAMHIENAVEDPGVSYTLKDFSVEMSNAVVNLEKGCVLSLPCEIYQQEQATFFLKITQLEESDMQYFSNSEVNKLSAQSINSLVEANSAMNFLVDVKVEGVLNDLGLKKQKIVGKWYHQLDINSVRNSTQRIEVLPKYGTLFESSSNNKLMEYDDIDGLNTVKDDVFISFSVSTFIKLNKIFSVQVLLVNNSTITKNLKLVIPSKYGKPIPNELDIKNDLDVINLVMKPDDFYNRFIDFEKREASLVCLEEEVFLPTLYPNTCESINLHFIPIKGRLHKIDNILVYDLDNKTNFIELKDVLQIYVED
ncbi:hypothetical protein HDU92_004293 [Lobulomyces angularis]|nr:hypothetical protein HDU92_004293 [Lobulomyces angularis]